GTLDYLDRMQGGRGRQLTRVERWREQDVLRYDAATERHLELFQPQPGGEPQHTLWHHLNQTVTGLGARRLRGWLARPLLSTSAPSSKRGARARSRPSRRRSRARAA